MKRCIVELIAKNYLDMMSVAYPEVSWFIIQDFEDFTVLAFEQDSMNICDPMVSTCGRFDYDLAEAAGEYKISTEAICTLAAVNKYLLSIQE